MNVLSLANIVMTGFFAYAAYLQLNDNDMLLWLSVYLLAGVSCFGRVVFSAADGKSRISSLLVAALCSLFLVSRLVAQMTFDSSTEYGRENLGLLIVIGWMLLCSKRTKASPLIAFGALGIALSLCVTAYRAPKMMVEEAL